MTDDQTASMFTGAWRLLSCETRDSSGLVQFPFGERPGGQLLYDGAGNMSAQLGRTNRARFAAVDPALGTDAEVRDAFDGYLAYFGTYAVDESTRTVTHHVVGASFPNWVGVNLARRMRIRRERTTPTGDATDRGGRSRARYVLLWERM